MEEENSKIGGLDISAFLEIADRFIDLANAENQKVEARDLHLAFLFAAARYNAYVGNAIIGVEDPEDYIQHMVGQYTEMLRQHMADGEIAKPA